MKPPRILVDADACPAEEVYHVAYHLGVSATVVSNSPLRVPSNR